MTYTSMTKHPVSTLPSTSPPETKALRETSQEFIVYFNSSQFENIFLMFSPRLQISLPLEKIKLILYQLKASYGRITKMVFEKYLNAYALYVTHFERGKLRISISIDSHVCIDRLFFKLYEEDTGPLMERNTTPMSLPVTGEWTICWGGDTKEQNQHLGIPFQKNAFDLIRTNAAGSIFHSDGKTNEDYYAFGQPVLSPCDGEIVTVVDGIKDNPPGIRNLMYVPGNTVILKTVVHEYVVVAHLKQFSIQVSQGDHIRQGHILGLCGNSGNSPEPHLHFHIQNMEDMTRATGVKCFFEKIYVNGQLQTDYSPVKGDKVHTTEE